MINSISRAINKVYRSIPPNSRYKLKYLLGLSGHSRSIASSIRAHRDASGKKRLDRTLKIVTETLKFANVSNINGYSCLEIGGGYVPSDSICFSLLGASEVIATDYNNISSQRALRDSVALSDKDEILDMVEDFCGGGAAVDRARIFLSDMADGNFDRLNYKYVAPIDLTREKIPGKFDLIYSMSVFEHINHIDLIPIINNLADMLDDDGIMINNIHMEDHRNFETAPFEFLTIDTDFDERRDVDARGNRIRLPDWIDIFNSVTGLDTVVIRQWDRKKNLPADDLLPEFRRYSPEDCFVGRAILATRRRGQIG